MPYMSNVESRRFAGTVVNGSGETVGEARFWGVGDRAAERWDGWLVVADLGGLPPPGRYRVVSFDGWESDFDLYDRPPARVFETDLVMVVGVGTVPWPEGEALVFVRPPGPIGTPWQGSRGIPPFKQQGDRGMLPVLPRDADGGPAASEAVRDRPRSSER
jgi:hypothetical protein